MDPDIAFTAIRRKFATTADVARRLGFNDQWEDLENGGGRDMRARDQGGPNPFPGMPRVGSGPSDQLSYGASESFDDRDSEAMGDPISYLVEGGPEAWSELRQSDPETYDRVSRWAKDRKLRAASNRRLNAHDHAIALQRARNAGQAGDVDVLNAMRPPPRRLAEDRARAAGAVSFTQMFPGAARIRHSF